MITVSHITPSTLHPQHTPVTFSPEIVCWMSQVLGGGSICVVGSQFDAPRPSDVNCVSTAAALSDTHEPPVYGSEARADLDAAGIGSTFHATPLSAGLDFKTLRRQIQNC